MKKSTEKFLTELKKKYPSLVACEKDIKKAFDILYDCYSNSGKVLVCGNGGSAADSEHIVGELMKGFLKIRPISEEKKAEMKKNCEKLSNSSGVNCFCKCSLKACNSSSFMSLIRLCVGNSAIKSILSYRLSIRSFARW